VWWVVVGVDGGCGGGWDQGEVVVEVENIHTKRRERQMRREKSARQNRKQAAATTTTTTKTNYTCTYVKQKRQSKDGRDC
jgi:hypothetical protein